MLLIAVYYRRCGRNLQAKLDTILDTVSQPTGFRFKRTSISVRGREPAVICITTECR